MNSSRERARAAFGRQAWGEAFDAFAAADREGPLGAEDHERLAIAAYLIGADEPCEMAWEAAHRAAREAGDTAGAAQCAVLLALCLVLRGQMARAGGWLARAEGLLAESGIECAASGYVLVPKVLGALESGDAAAALELSVRATELGRRFDDADLRALGVLGQGQALIAMEDNGAGLARLDEAMVAVTTGDVGPVVSGIVYCAVIIECLRLFDWARASEWTAALSAWCDAQPDLVPYRGQCLVHRAQLQQAAGSWPEAIASAEAACRRLNDPPHPALGLAHYQEAELHRLVGEFDRAEAEYREASRHGHDPMPGLALLELARGDAAAAATSIGRVLQETAKPLERPSLLAAAVDICRSAGNLSGAREAADELAAVVSSSSPSPLLRAMAAHAAGSVLLAEGDPVAALAELRAATGLFRSLGMPYEEARTAVLLGLACASLGDRTAAALECDNARETFAQLGARPDLDRLARLAGVFDEPAGDDALSEREREVLIHLAAGKTNREIAATLTISPHTVGRHVENIFAKLGVTSRAAATASAYEHHLLSKPAHR
jgi:ATP/maltotriose-dependent transcriptional regulator MalT